MLRLVTIIAAVQFAVVADAQPTAEDDAAFAIRVFAEQIVESERLAEQGVVTEAELDDLRIRLTDAKLQYAIAQGSPHKRLVKLLRERIKLSKRKLARVQRLADRGIVSDTALETAKHDHRETLISLATEVGDWRAVIRLLEQQIAAATKQIQKSQRLTERRVVTRAALAQERLHLATLKNRLTAAERALVAAGPSEIPDDAI